jgi:hypothetical protein
MGKILQIVYMVTILLVTVTVNMTDAQGELSHTVCVAIATGYTVACSNHQLKNYCQAVSFSYDTFCIHGYVCTLSIPVLFLLLLNFDAPCNLYIHH